jgi:hypothetical protein
MQKLCLKTLSEIRIRRKVHIAQRNSLRETGMECDIKKFTVVNRKSRCSRARKLGFALLFLMGLISNSWPAAISTATDTTDSDFGSGLIKFQVTPAGTGDAGVVQLQENPNAAYVLEGVAGWKYRRAITINNASGSDLTDFQVWIATSQFGADWNLIRSSAQPAMADFRFTTAVATSTIPYWIDYNTVTPRGFWVRVPSLPAGSSTIYMYYGNQFAAAVSSPSATFVREIANGRPLTGSWAFDGNATDASGNGNHGTITGATQTPGKFGAAYSFNGSGNFITIPQDSFLIPSVIASTVTTQSDWPSGTLDNVVAPGAGNLELQNINLNLTFTNTSTGRTGTIQSWTVPYTGVYRIESWGARGGDQSPGEVSAFHCGNPSCGFGRKVRGDFQLTAGTVLKILVGQMGENTHCTDTDYDGRGGGGSFVV